MRAASSASGLWARWKRLAHRAAEIQAHVLLFLLYVVVVTPMGLVRRAFAGSPPPTAWQTRPAPAAGDGLPEARLREARRQF